MTGVVCAFESIDKQFPEGRTKVVIQFVALESEDIKNTIGVLRVLVQDYDQIAIYTYVFRHTF